MVTVLGKRAKPAGHIDDAGGLSFAQRREHACMTANAPRKFVRKTRSTTSSRAVGTGPSEGSLMPALLTRMSSRPKPVVIEPAPASMEALRLLGILGSQGHDVFSLVHARNAYFRIAAWKYAL